MTRKTYSLGDRVGNYSIISKTDQRHGKNTVFNVKCRLCERVMLKTLHKMKEPHAGCFSFNRQVARSQLVRDSVTLEM